MAETEFEQNDSRRTDERRIDGSITILVADNCATVVAVTRRMLEVLGYRVLTARDAEHTVKVLEAHRDEVHLVILDMVMPGMGGSETRDRLWSIDPQLPVLVCSGYFPEGHQTRGPGDFLQKPFDMAELADKVARLVCPDLPCNNP